MPYHVRTKGEVTWASGTGNLQEREAMLLGARRLALELMRTPRPFDLVRRFGDTQIVAVFRTPEALLVDAKLLPQKFTPDELLAALRNFTERIGHQPTETEVNDELSMPAAMVYRNMFGSLSAAQQQADTGSFADPRSQRLLGAIETGRGYRLARQLSEAEKDARTAKNGAGQKNWKQVREVMKVAQEESWSPEMFEAAVRVFDPTVAEVLVNLTHPERGIRLGPKDLADRLSLESVFLVRSIETRLEPFCKTTMKWRMAPESEETRRRSEAFYQGQSRWRGVRDLMVEARGQHWSMADFTERLAMLDPKVSAVFENMTNPLGGIRLIPVRMAKIVQISLSLLLQGWQQELQEFCETMKWSTVTLLPIHQERVNLAVEGEQRWKRVKDIEEVARANHWTMAQFDERLYAADEKVGLVFRNLTQRADDQRISQDDFSETLGVNVLTVKNWEKRLRGICRKMEWPDPEPRKRGPHMREVGAVDIAPNANVKEAVAAAVRKLSTSNGFANVDLMSRPEPMITPAELMKVPSFEKMPVQLKDGERGFELKSVDWKKLATPPSTHRYAGSVDLPLFIGSDTFLAEPPLGMIVMGDAILIGGVALVAAAMAVEVPSGIVAGIARGVQVILNPARPILAY